MCNAIQVAFCSVLISQSAWPPAAPTGWLWGSTSVFAGSGWQEQPQAAGCGYVQEVDLCQASAAM